MDIAFAGTPQFAAWHLEALLKAPGFNVVAVITQPDKRGKRGNKLAEFISLLGLSTIHSSSAKNQLSKQAQIVLDTSSRQQLLHKSAWDDRHILCADPSETLRGIGLVR